MLDYPKDISIQKTGKIYYVILAILKERFIFIEYGDGDDISSYTHAFENGTGIQMTKIRTQNFLPIFQAINSVDARYNPKILREFIH